MSFIFKIGWVAAIVFGAALGIHQWQAATAVPQIPIVSGGFSPSGGGTYRLGQSIGTTDTTIKLSSFKEPVSNIPYTMSYLGSDILYGTLSPQSTISEFISATGITQNADGSATLTGVTRGLTRTPAGNFCTASTTLTTSHAGQSIFILSNSPCFQAEYLPLRTVATSSAATVIGSTTPWRYDSPAAQASGTYISTTSELASIAYVNKIAIAGSSNSTETVNGIVQLATKLQQAASTILGSTGGGLVLQARYASSTPVPGIAANIVPVTDTNGFLNAQFIGTTTAYTYNFTGPFTTVQATSTSFGIGGYLNWNTLGYTIGATRQASSSVLTENGAGSLSWNVPKVITLGVTSPYTTNSGTATTTEATIVIPANSLSTTKSISVTAQTNIAAGNCAAEVDFGNGSATTSAAFVMNGGTMNGTISATSTTAQATFFTGQSYGNTSNNGTAASLNTFVNFAAYTNASQLYIAVRDRAISSGTCNFVGVTVQLLSN